jgi:hypothetical protein
MDDVLNQLFLQQYSSSITEMIIKLLKIFSILIVATLLVGILIQISDFAIINKKKKSPKYTRQTNGVFIEYYQNGKISSEEFYQDGLRYGNWRFYYEDGALKKELNYEKGMLEGIQRYFSTQGNIIYTEQFHKGQLKTHIIKNDSLYRYQVKLISNGEKIFEKECKSCHLSKKGKIIHPYYLQKLSGDSLAIDTLFINYFSQIHQDSLQLAKIDSINIYDVHAVIHYIDKQYQTAKRRPKQAIRLQKIRINKNTPQL